MGLDLFQKETCAKDDSGLHEESNRVLEFFLTAKKESELVCK